VPALDTSHSSGRRPSRAQDAGFDFQQRSSLLSRAEIVPQRLFHTDLDSTDVLVPRPALYSPSLGGESASQLVLHIFDHYALNPDDPSVVRFSSSGEIIAATPTRLIAHITSPDFLDYELLSDFFLTFRAFLSSSDLLVFLLARLRWAVDRPDDYGRIVRVRTFVALRHWILNFVEDFLPDFALRFQFCEMVNSLYHDLKRRGDGGGSDLNIVSELKKCWRRTFGLYWPLPPNAAPQDDILPGGHYEAIPPVEGEVPVSKVETTSEPVERPKTPDNSRNKAMVRQSTQAPISPTSVHSLHVVSCSIPFRPIYRPDPSTAVPLFPHPVQIGGPSANATGNATTLPRHKRSGSFTDALRDDRVAAAGDVKMAEAMQDYSVPSGSLIRGCFVQPATPYFEYRAARVPPAKLNLESEPPQTDSGPASPVKSPTNSDGMKKLFGSVRRALSNNLGMSHGSNRSDTSVHSNEARSPVLSADAEKAAFTTAEVSRVQTRMDVLSSWAAERFRLAVEEQQLKDAMMQAAEEAGMGPGDLDSGFSAMAIPVDPSYPQRSVTVGSRSIVIVDDTDPEDHVMSGALPVPDLSKYSRSSSSAVPQDATQAARQDQPTQSATAVYLPTGYKSPLRHSTSNNPLRGSKQRFSNSIRSELSRVSSLQRFASYHSGDGGPLSWSKPTDPRAPRPVSASSDVEPDAAYKVPARQLRRKPGGNLKAATKQNDPDGRLQRRHSVGSLSTVSKSVQNSLAYPEERESQRMPKPDDDGKSHRTSGTRRRRTSISLIQTHSSQPNLRPSFEAEVARLKALPDDDDDGGVHATLLKLEGKYEKRSPVSPAPDSMNYPEFDSPQGEDRHKKHHEHVEDIHPEHGLPEDIGSRAENPHTRSIYHVSKSTLRTHRGTLVGEETESSFSETPLLERRAMAPQVPGMSAAIRDFRREDDFPTVEALLRHADSINSSAERLAEVRTLNQQTALEGPPAEGQRRHRLHAITSFLLDDAQELSDDAVLAAPPSRGGEEAAVQGAGAKEPEPKVPRTPQRAEVAGEGTEFKQGLPTPAVSPTKSASGRGGPRSPAAAATHRVSPVSLTYASGLENLTGKAAAAQAASTAQPPQKQATPPRHSLGLPAHLPFILAYSPVLVARQLTLIEIDGLCDLDWRELIELRWNQAPPNVSDWASYLGETADGDGSGVGLVIARFNLMVKWVISTIVLTADQGERVAVVERFARVADECRRVRNFATAYQIAVALLSADVAALKGTWRRVGKREREVVRELEALVQPLRNFHNLRVEMECVPADAGCVPFIGVYTRDLVYNAQKPPVVAAPGAGRAGAGAVPGEEPLVNFERYRQAASVVKTLLRLLEGGYRYSYAPDFEVLGRCLWVSALSEAEIKERVTALAGE
jgi:hypothetical protein